MNTIEILRDYLIDNCDEYREKRWKRDGSKSFFYTYNNDVSHSAGQHIEYVSYSQNYYNNPSDRINIYFEMTKEDGYGEDGYLEVVSYFDLEDENIKSFGDMKKQFIEDFFDEYMTCFDDYDYDFDEETTEEDYIDFFNKKCEEHKELSNFRDFLNNFEKEFSKYELKQKLDFELVKKTDYNKKSISKI